MRRIEFNEPQSDSWEKWKEKCGIETKSLIKNWKPGNTIKIKNKLYKGQKDFYFSKEGPFRRKCAFCEKGLTIFEDLDHYRPKKLVTDENDAPIKVVIDGQKIDHPGYYWLAYSCHNLLPACKVCNSASTEDNKPIGKRNRFPVVGKHSFKPGDEKRERPLLLNPIFDDIDNHLIWDSAQKIIVAKPGSEKGKMTIEVLGFYQREQLREDWGKAYDDVFRKMCSYLSPEVVDQKKKIEKYKKNIHDGVEPFSFASKAALKELTELTNYHEQN